MKSSKDNSLVASAISEGIKIDGSIIKSNRDNRAVKTKLIFKDLFIFFTPIIFLSQNAEGQEQQEHTCRHGYDKENNISYAKSEQGFVIGFAVGFFASISEEREKFHKFD